MKFVGNWNCCKRRRVVMNYLLGFPNEIIPADFQMCMGLYFIRAFFFVTPIRWRDHSIFHGFFFSCVQNPCTTMWKFLINKRSVIWRNVSSDFWLCLFFKSKFVITFWCLKQYDANNFVFYYEIYRSETH